MTVSAPGKMTCSGPVLHVGCGGDTLPDWLECGAEVRLDIDPLHAPDVVASMTDMGQIGPFDAVYSSHSLEHLDPHEVATALGEFLRVLKPGGAALIFVPDMEDVEPTEDVLFVSPAGPITGLDLIHGYRPALAEMPYMAHRTGFVRETLLTAILKAGFERAEVQRLDCYNLFAAAVKA